MDRTFLMMVLAAVLGFGAGVAWIVLLGGAQQ